ncbi:MAG TPA: VPLPA-CTERM sorting domain-containing protein [Steroidobacteraceae bacterium]
MRHSALTISAICALVLGPVPAANALTLSLLPEQGMVQAGATALIDVVASGLADGENVGAIGGYDLNVAFNPTLLSWTSTAFGSGLNVTGLGDIQDSRLLPSNPAVVDTAETSLDTAADLAALQPNSFVLFTLSLTGIASGTSALDLSIGSLTDERGNPLAANVQGSSLTVTPVPLPAAVWLLLSGLGSVLGFGRSRRVRT